SPPGTPRRSPTRSPPSPPTPTGSPSSVPAPGRGASGGSPPRRSPRAWTRRSPGEPRPGRAPLAVGARALPRRRARLRRVGGEQPVERGLRGAGRAVPREHRGRPPRECRLRRPDDAVVAGRAHRPRLTPHAAGREPGVLRLAGGQVPAGRGVEHRRGRRDGRRPPDPPAPLGV